MLELKQIIKESQRIVFFGGAGVSTESGIPDFRSEKGLYHAVQSYGRSPEDMLSHSFFQENTQTFFDYYKNNLVHKDALPNQAHKVLALLEKQGKMLGVVTQNIDGLHQLAGSKKVYELHGSVLRNYCMDCGKFYGLDDIVESEGIPVCSCGGTVKPDVVLYQEPLDEKVIDGAVGAIREADTLIIGGTSLAVYPAAGFINYFRGKHLVLINKTSTPYDAKADLVIHKAIGAVLGQAVEE